MNLKMIRNATVKAYALGDRSDLPEAQSRRGLRIVIDGLAHTFAPGSPEAKLLEYAAPDRIAERLTGGSFFFVNDALVDYRRPEYRGFVHDDASIEKLAEIVGIDQGKARGGSIAPHPVFNRFRRSSMSGVFLGGRSHPFDYQAAGFGNGGKFDVNLVFRWSPFSETVNSVLEILRLICTNGMVGVSPLINADVPIMNRHEEHLGIAAEQIQSRFGRLMTERLEDMVEHRATVALLNRISSEADNRLKAGFSEPLEKLQRLRQIRDVASPWHHLQEVYTQDQLMNAATRELLPGHLTEYDAYNLMTEMDTYGQVEGGNLMTVVLNKLLFERRDLIRRQKAAVLSAAPLSVESDHERAFFSAIKTASKF